MKNILFATALLAASVEAAAAQSREPADAPFAVSVSVRSARLVHGVTTVSLVVKTDASSGEKLSMLMLDAPSPVVTIDKPAATGRSLVDTLYGNDPVAAWTLIGRSKPAPGDTTPTFRFSAEGLPDTVRYWALPDLLAHPPIDEEQAEDSTIDPVKSYSLTGITVGVRQPEPNATDADLVAGLVKLSDFACGGAAWIPHHGTCQSLSAKLASAQASLSRGERTAARGALRAFEHELDAQFCGARSLSPDDASAACEAPDGDHQRGSSAHVTEDAYALLRPYVEFLIAHL